MTVDLKTCVPGQKVRLRNGNIVEYQELSQKDTLYPYRVGYRSYKADGHYYYEEESVHDIIEIFPIETTESTKSDKHPSLAWWGSCPWITDRKPTEKDGDQFNQVIMKVNNTSNFCFMHWEYVESGYPWVHSLSWNHPKQTPKEKAVELINKHENGWIPTPEQWDIISKGLKE